MRGKRETLIVAVRRRFDHYFGWCVTAFLFGVLTAGIERHDDPTTLSENLQFFCLIFPAAWLAWLATVHPKVEVHQSGLEVVNWFFRYRIPWPAVKAFALQGELVIELVDGGRVKPAVGGQSLASAIRGGRTQRGMYAKIEEARSVAQDVEMVDTTVSRHLDVKPLVFLPIGALFVVYIWIVSI